MIAEPTENAADDNSRPRLYVGRHVPPPLPARPPRLTIAERIDRLTNAMRLARQNAHMERDLGDLAGSAYAFYRAHEYAEMIRELKGRL